MADSDHDSTSNTDDLISGVHRLDEISPLHSPRTPETKLTKANQEPQSGKQVTVDTPTNTCFDKSTPGTVQVRPSTPRSRSLSPQSRVRVHYTDSAREALDLANKSYERLVEESDERHKLTILLNKRDVERAEQAQKEVERTEARNSINANITSSGVKHSAPEINKENRPHQPVTIIQEHIRFAESILASPASSDAGSRSRSLSPLSGQHRVASPNPHLVVGSRSRSSSPLARTAAPAGLPMSSRKKLSFDSVNKRSTSPLLSRSGREKTARQIRTQATNDFIDATSHGLHQPVGRFSAARMADKEGSVPSSERNEEFVDIYTTPEKGSHTTHNGMHTGPMSSTPHNKHHRQPLREISPSKLHPTQPQSKPEEQMTSTSTPSSYIRGLQSVRSGLRKLMADEMAAAADEPLVDNSRRPDNVNLRIESTINAENQLLRDQLARERSLRKQVEADKHELQAQLLESKDRLHHLTSTLKQKDAMMKKLDQNLEDVVKGWQKHEQDNKYKTESLNHNIRRLERDLEDQRRHAAGLENDLSNAVDDLRRERDTSKDYARETSEQQTRLQEEITDLKNFLEREKEKVLRLELEGTQAEEGRLHVERQLDALQETLDQERDNFKEREQELLNKINEITSVQIAVLEQEAARTKAQTEKIEELDNKARKFEQEAETQRHLVSNKVKELERLQSLLELTDAKHQNALRQLESKLRIELEVRVSQARDDGLKRMADNEINLQQAHQRQLSDVVAEHNRQLGSMRERFNNELNRVKSHLEDQLRSSDSALEDAKQELESVQTLKEAAESQRDDLTSRLQAVLSLLGAAAGNQGFLAPPHPPAPISSDYGSSVTLSHQPSSTDISHLPPTYVTSKDPTADVSSSYFYRPPVPQRGAVITKEMPAAESTMSEHAASSGGNASDGKATTQAPYEGEDSQPTNEREVAGDGQPQYQQQYEQHRQQLKGDGEVDKEADDEKDDISIVSTTETFDLNDNDDSQYRHKRQAELQDYIKKLLNRSVGDPLIETRIDLDESHISVISGLQEHSVILHDGNHHHQSPKKAFHHEMVGQTPPVKGSTKKVDPKEIASLISKYGSEAKPPSTTEYIEYLKSVAVNNHTGLLKDLDSKAQPAASTKGSTKRALASSFNSSTSSRTCQKKPTSRSRVIPSSPESSTISKQAKEKDRTKVKRHSSTRSQAIWK